MASRLPVATTARPSCVHLQHEPLGLLARVAEVAAEDVGDVGHEVDRVVPHDGLPRQRRRRTASSATRSASSCSIVDVTSQPDTLAASLARPPSARSARLGRSAPCVAEGVGHGPVEVHLGPLAEGRRRRPPRAAATHPTRGPEAGSSVVDELAPEALRSAATLPPAGLPGSSSPAAWATFAARAMNSTAADTSW